MKRLFLLCVLLIQVGCAAVKPPVGSDSRFEFEYIKSQANIYAKLINTEGTYFFTDFCEDSNFINTGFSGLQDCGNDLSNPWNNYVSLNSLKPAFNLGGHICNTIGFMVHYASQTTLGGKEVDQCRPQKYWRADIAWGEFANWLLIYPIIGMSYYEDVYFDWNLYKQAVNEALSNIDRQDYLAKLDVAYKLNESIYKQDMAKKELASFHPEMGNFQKSLFRRSYNDLLAHFCLKLKAFSASQ